MCEGVVLSGMKIQGLVPKEVLMDLVSMDMGIQGRMWKTARSANALVSFASGSGKRGRAGF